ncbi:hypothetical protein ABT034_25470 [Streptomyces sp. NPDC002773]|uniref:hypothetical protein n=1 Tax=Streptomyces sp. NPDC002773 TaxID=3154430 RepID=UPI003333A449
MGDVDGGRTVGRMVRVSVLVLLVEAALTTVVRTALAEPGEGPAGLLAMSTSMPMWLLGLVAAAVLLVLPVVWLSEELERRLGGRADIWVPVVAAAGAMVPVLSRTLSAGAGPTGTPGEWLTAAAALTAAGLITRRSGRRGFRRKTPAR